MELTHVGHIGDHSKSMYGHTRIMSLFSRKNKNVIGLYELKGFYPTRVIHKAVRDFSFRTIKTYVEVEDQETHIYYKK